jgi:regulator of sigma E protease
MAQAIRDSDGRALTFNVTRNKEGGSNEQLQFTLKGTDDTAELAVIEGNTGRKSVKIGIVPDTVREEVTFGQAIVHGYRHVEYLCIITVRGLVGMIQGAISPKHISGPIFIFKEAAKSAKKGVEHLLDFMTFLSVSLAILNLLPIPILDGGHLLFFTIQAIRGGKPVSLRVQEFANQVGMLLLLLLMIFAFGNDLLKL